MKFEFTATVLAACLASQANAFWGTAHLLVANVAQTILESEAPNSFQAALNELQTLTDSNPSLVSFDENSHPFTECATWADDIKGKGYSFQSEWHFINQPLMLDDTTLEDSNFVMPDIDVLEAIAVISMFLENTGDYANTTYYQQILDAVDGNEADARSFALRLLIHYTGDIHQPLHSVAGVSDHYDHGDAGGNYESIPSIDGAGNLHAVWDSVLYNYCGFPNLPLSDSDWSDLLSEADTLTETYPVTDAEVLPGQLQMWAAEAFDLAVEYVYPGVIADGQGNKLALTDEYIAAAEPVIKKQITLGGRRLAELIKQIYPNDSTTSFLQ